MSPLTVSELTQIRGNAPLCTSTVVSLGDQQILDSVKRGLRDSGEIGIPVNIQLEKHRA